MRKHILPPGGNKPPPLLKPSTGVSLFIRTFRDRAQSRGGVSQSRRVPQGTLDLKSNNQVVKLPRPSRMQPWGGQKNKQGFGECFFLANRSFHSLLISCD
jgi:hypothetical protein